MKLMFSKILLTYEILLLLILQINNKCYSYIHKLYKDITHPNSLNCTWKYIEQPISHFSRGISSDIYQQRLCIYDSYWKPNQNLPIFLYTGNESPVEEYVNNTGLLWNLALEFNALVVFAEHRYFGESIPNINMMDNCLAFLSSEEALADYASLANRIRNDWGGNNGAIIAFGGSYGGMLSAWLRIKYPHVIDGAISASAPIWGFPLDDCPVDSSARVVSYAASAAAGSSMNCVNNLKASYVFITDIGSTAEGREVLSNAMNLCSPLLSNEDVTLLLRYLQTPLFDLAEGSYPFKSNYITYAILGTTHPLPAWAMQVMCEYLRADYGIRLEGDEKNVLFNLWIDNLEIYVDWDQTSNNHYSIQDVKESPMLLTLLSNVAQSIQVWYNVSGDMPSCIDWNSISYSNRNHRSLSKHDRLSQNLIKRTINTEIDIDIISPIAHDLASLQSNAEKMKTTCTLSPEDFKADIAWNALVCNEGINLVPWWVQGVGNDLYWPPNQPTRNYSMEELVHASLDYCIYLQELGLYGIPSKRDEWARWINTAYGGINIKYATNIVFTNGNLDPWSPAGVSSTTSSRNSKSKETLSTSVVSVSIDMGGHHLDLFWPNENDPESVKRVREIERDHVRQWIDEAANDRNII